MQKIINQTSQLATRKFDLNCKINELKIQFDSGETSSNTMLENLSQNQQIKFQKKNCNYKKIMKSGENTNDENQYALKKDSRDLNDLKNYNDENFHIKNPIERLRNTNPIMNILKPRQIDSSRIIGYEIPNTQEKIYNNGACYVNFNPLTPNKSNCQRESSNSKRKSIRNDFNDVEYRTDSKKVTQKDIKSNIELNKQEITPIRYSKMSEEEAACAFENRKQEILKNLFRTNSDKKLLNSAKKKPDANISIIQRNTRKSSIEKSVTICNSEGRIKLNTLINCSNNNSKNIISNDSDKQLRANKVSKSFIVPKNPFDNSAIQDKNFKKDLGANQNCISSNSSFINIISVIKVPFNDHVSSRQNSRLKTYSRDLKNQLNKVEYLTPNILRSRSMKSQNVSEIEEKPIQDPRPWDPCDISKNSITLPSAEKDSQKTQINTANELHCKSKVIYGYINALDSVIMKLKNEAKSNQDDANSINNTPRKQDNDIMETNMLSRILWEQNVENNESASPFSEKPKIKSMTDLNENNPEQMYQLNKKLPFNNCHLPMNNVLETTFNPEDQCSTFTIQKEKSKNITKDVIGQSKLKISNESTVNSQLTPDLLIKIEKEQDKQRLSYSIEKDVNQKEFRQYEPGANDLFAKLDAFSENFSGIMHQGLKKEFDGDIQNNVNTISTAALSQIESSKKNFKNFDYLGLNINYSEALTNGQSKKCYNNAILQQDYRTGRSRNSSETSRYSKNNSSIPGTPEKKKIAEKSPSVSNRSTVTMKESNKISSQSLDIEKETSQKKKDHKMKITQIRVPIEDLQSISTDRNTIDTPKRKLTKEYQNMHDKSIINKNDFQDNQHSRNKFSMITPKTDRIMSLDEPKDASFISISKLTDNLSRPIRINDVLVEMSKNKSIDKTKYSFDIFYQNKSSHDYDNQRILYDRHDGLYNFITNANSSNNPNDYNNNDNRMEHNTNINFNNYIGPKVMRRSCSNSVNPRKSYKQGIIIFLIDLFI